MAIVEHSPTGLVERVLAVLLRTALRALLKPVFSPRVPIRWQRRWLEWLSRVTLVPRGARIEAAVVGGVPGEWVRCRDAAPRPGVVLYLHGGAYCLGSPATHRAITTRLARSTGMAVFALDYRLAPEHRFPAAVDDARAAARALQAQGEVVLAGDSAGGGLAVATALALRDASETPPAGLILLSPWVDMAPEHAPAAVPPGEVMLSVPWGEACARHCLGDADPHQPLASPLLADLRGLPPVLLEAGTDELLHGQALAFHDALQAAGVPVRCEITHERWHVFQMHGGVLASADASLARMAGFAIEAVDGTRQAAAAGRPVEHEVVVLGAGMSGLCMGAELRRAGCHDFVIVEKSDGLGGTWWDNRYPGAQVDVPAPLYAFSFAPNPAWSRRFATAPEILAYMHRVVQRHGLGPHLRLGTRIRSAAFDESVGRWRIETDRGPPMSARFFVCSVGPLSAARWPDLEGLESFAGPRLHSARWPPSIDLAGRRVAVIGTGASAAQIVPELARSAARLHVFQRTANWILPRRDRRYGALGRTLVHFPPYAKAVRACWRGVLEWGRRGFDEGLARRLMVRAAERHLAHQVRDPALRAKLVPPYPFGCKRLQYSNDYYPTLQRPNVELVTDPVARVTPRGIVTADGRERELDAIVCATGFDVQGLLTSVEVTGAGGRRLAEAWRDGAEAWHGVTVSGFPNLFLMLGPNTGTGHTSTLLYIEAEVRYALACMAHLRATGQRWLDLKPEVLREHNRALQQRLAGSVWTHCRSWYRLDAGRVVALWPGFTREYERALRRPRWDDYRFG